MTDNQKETFWGWVVCFVGAVIVCTGLLFGFVSVVCMVTLSMVFAQLSTSWEMTSVVWVVIIILLETCLRPLTPFFSSS